MKTMKYPNILSGCNMAVSGSNSVDEVDSIFTSSCWQNANNDFITTNKIILDNSISNLGSDKLLLDSAMQDEGEIETKNTMEALDNLLGTDSMSIAELKPLPPFTGYTANLSINGIQGHHFHTISEENNNYANYNEQNIVSSSTCNMNADSASELGFGECVTADSSAIKYEDCSRQDVDSATQIKTEIAEYDISSIEDIAAVIGSAIAGATVPNNNTEDDDPNASKDSWLDEWISREYVDQPKGVVINPDSISEFLIPNNSSEFSSVKSQHIAEYNKAQQQGNSTLQNLLTHGNMPLLHYRLQNGAPIKQETPSSTNYPTELISTSSPPANVVSTTDNILLTVNGRFMSQYNVHSMHDDHRIRSPELLGQNYPHTTSTTPNANKKARSRAQKKQHQPGSANVFNDQAIGLLGKEKPIHRCTICNRGFLNKSNIKVHLRTHTGEKPFRCDTCAKAFRQKAHLLKHQQIHKRIGRD